MPLRFREVSQKNPSFSNLSPKEIAILLDHIKDRCNLFSLTLTTSRNYLWLKSCLAGIISMQRQSKPSRCVFFSNFNTREQSFTKFVDQLRKSNSQAVTYEKILKDASFPELYKEYPNNNEAELLQQDIPKFLRWLRKSPRGVHEIINLTVQGRLLCPHIDKDVSWCVNEFNVQQLNWRKLDLYLGHLHKTWRSRHLYSSGKMAALDHWANYLPRFPKLTRLHIYVEKNVLSLKRAEEIRIGVQKRFDGVNKSIGNRWFSIEDDNGNGKLAVQQLGWESLSHSIIPRMSNIMSPRHVAMMI